jgi:aldehyde dehydrogenase (NAD+)
MALPAQAEQAERLIQEALAEGACLLVPREATPASGGPARFTPTVVADARPEMALCREASFAPLLAVLAFDTLDEALRGDGQCPYGLGASVFTGHPARAARLTDRLRTGMVTVNDVIVPTGHPATPFGGRGASGWGVTQGAEGLLEMTVPQVVSVRAGTFRPHYDLDTAPPAGRIEMLRGLLEWSHGRGLGHRWRGLWQLARGTWRTVKSRAPASSDKGQVPPRGEQRA